MRETLLTSTPLSLGGRPICNLRLADGIDLLGGSNNQLQELADIRVDRAGAYGVEVSSKKSKLMVNSANNISADITMNGHKLDVEAFKYLGSTITTDGRSPAEVKIRIAFAMSAMAGRSRIIMEEQGHQLLH